MNTNTIKFVPASPNDAEDIAEFLGGLSEARLRLTTPMSDFKAPVLQRWTVTDEEVCITFSPGVLEIVGEIVGLERDALKILKALGMSA